MFGKALKTVVVAAFLSAAPAALAAGGSGGGGGTAAPCGALTFTVVPTITSTGAVPGYFDATGTTSKGCDGSANYAIGFADISAPDGCTVSIATFQGSTYQPKYGAKPISRYLRSFFPWGDCAGRPRTIAATLTDVTTGVVLGTATATFTP